MLFRDDRQMAISGVETLCIEVADRYAAVADKAGDRALAGLFAELAQQHRQYAAALARQIRSDDDLPQPPDPDKEAVKDVLTGIKGFLHGDVRDTLLEERERGEGELADAARAALRFDLQAGVRHLLEDILAHAETARGRLAAMRAA